MGTAGWTVCLPLLLTRKLFAREGASVQCTWEKAVKCCGAKLMSQVIANDITIQRPKKK